VKIWDFKVWDKLWASPDYVHESIDRSQSMRVEKKKWRRKNGIHGRIWYAWIRKLVAASYWSNDVGQPYQRLEDGCRDRPWSMAALEASRRLRCLDPQAGEERGRRAAGYGGWWCRGRAVPPRVALAGGWRRRGSGEMRSWTSSSVGCAKNRTKVSERCARMRQDKWIQKEASGLTVLVGIVSEMWRNIELRRRNNAPSCPGDKRRQGKSKNRRNSSEV
jgi:hypothetical protein